MTTTEIMKAIHYNYNFFKELSYFDLEFLMKYIKREFESENRKPSECEHAESEEFDINENRSDLFCKNCGIDLTEMRERNEED